MVKLNSKKLESITRYLTIHTNILSIYKKYVTNFLSSFNSGVPDTISDIQWYTDGSKFDGKLGYGLENRLLVGSRFLRLEAWEEHALSTWSSWSKDWPTGWMGCLRPSTFDNSNKNKNNKFHLKKFWPLIFTWNIWGMFVCFVLFSGFEALIYFRAIAPTFTTKLVYN